MSNKDDWEVYPEELARRLGVSRRTINSHFEKLEQAGYLKVIRVSSGRGKGVKVYRFFSDMPITDSYFNYIKSQLSTDE